MSTTQVKVWEKPYSLDDLFSNKSHVKYIVPLYQREYAWGNAEITQLLNDFYEAFLKSHDRTYHIGIVVVIRRSSSFEGQLYELIDGQQRFTTLSILYRLLLAQDSLERKVFFENRPEAEIFLNDLFQNASTSNLNPHAFRNAMDVIREFYYGNASWEQLLEERSKEPSGGKKITFRDFLLHKVKLFVVEMPLTTDVSRYFEVMNNRGRQLEPHELLKAWLWDRFHGEQELETKDETERERLERLFNDIWNELVHMNGHFERHVHNLNEFHDNHDWIHLEMKSEEDSNRSGELQSVINDSQNFLMHVLKQYYQYKGWTQKEDSGQESVPLDERLFTVTFEKALRRKEVDGKDAFSATEFIGFFLRMRLKYDRYVVKAHFENNEVQGWKLQRYNQADSKLHNTYKDSSDSTEQNADKESSVNKKLVKLQSMLQVTYRSRRYKNWLQVILGSSEEELRNPTVMIAKLSSYVRNAFNDILEGLDGDGSGCEPLLNQGLQTPHLVFNLIDYLMWQREPNQADFVFTYL